MFERLPAIPPHPVRWATSDALLVLLGAQLLSIVWAGLVLSGLYGESIPQPLPIGAGIVANIGLWIGYGLGPVWVAKNKGEGPVPDYGARILPIEVPTGLVLGVILQLVVLPLLYWPLLRFVDGDPSEAARELVASIDSPIEWGLFALTVVVIAPLVEELFYRGLLLRALEARFGVVVAVVVSAAVFAVVHRQVLALPGLFLFGVAAAIVVLRSGRLGLAWAMHAGFNAATLVLLALEG